MVLEDDPNPFNIRQTSSVCGCLLATAYFAHMFFAQKKQNYYKWSWWTVTLLNALVMVVILSVFFGLFAVSFIPGLDERLADELESGDIQSKYNCKV